MKDNIVLVGMPGSGKSTLGKRFAQTMGMSFVDTDDLIEQRHGCRLQDILDRHGYRHLREVEQSVLCDIDLTGHVISTGGSAVYSTPAMNHLQSVGNVVYLHISMDTLVRRVDNSTARGLAKMPSQSLRGLYRERLPLYQHWADITLENNWPLSAWRLDFLSQTLQKSIKLSGQ